MIFNSNIIKGEKDNGKWIKSLEDYNQFFVGYTSRYYMLIKREVNLLILKRFYYFNAEQILNVESLIIQASPAFDKKYFRPNINVSKRVLEFYLDVYIDKKIENLNFKDIYHIEVCVKKRESFPLFDKILHLYLPFWWTFNVNKRTYVPKIKVSSELNRSKNGRSDLWKVGNFLGLLASIIESLNSLPWVSKCFGPYASPNSSFFIFLKTNKLCSKNELRCMLKSYCFPIA